MVLMNHVRLMALMVLIRLVDWRALMVYMKLMGGLGQVCGRWRLVRRQVMVGRDLVVRKRVVRGPLMGLGRLVGLRRLMDYGGGMVRVGVLVARMLGVNGVGARIVALLKLLSRIPLLLLLVLLVGAGRTMLWEVGRLVVVGLVVFRLVLSARLGHGRRRLLERRGSIIRARHSGEAMRRGRRDARLGAKHRAASMTAVHGAMMRLSRSCTQCRTGERVMQQRDLGTRSWFWTPASQQQADEGETGAIRPKVGRRGSQKEINEVGLEARRGGTENEDEEGPRFGRQSDGDYGGYDMVCRVWMMWNG